MTVQKGMGFYHVGAANTNRTVRVKVVANLTNAFVELMGTTETHPFTGKIASPTTNQLIAQARLDAVVRAMCVYAIPVKVEVATTSGANDSVIVAFETDRSGVFFVGGVNSVSDIADTLGLAGHAAKTKDGLQTLVTALIANKSLDGGATKLFDVNPALADGTVSTASAITTLTASII